MKLNKDPCDKFMEAGIPCGRELIDNPFGEGIPEGPIFAPHFGGFFNNPMYDYDVPPLEPPV